LRTVTARCLVSRHDTGEGGFSPYHQQNGGDIIWEIGSGYFGCRKADGAFNPDRFAEVAASDQIKMIEIKLSQGAKPGHGGVLPGAKVTSEIAAIRGVAEGKDCLSPARHSAFSTPVEMMGFIADLRRLSAGKPVGFKLCLGHSWEFLAICKAMLETKIYPDFIVVDGKEGGTGAAPLEFMDHLGMPMREGLVFVHNALTGIGARERIRIGVAGKITTAFDIARAMALGADWCNSARAFMFSLGCIQSLSCHTDRCPTGVATQDPTRGRALVVADKSERVYNFHRSTVEALAELTAAAGLDHPSDFRPVHFWRRLNVREATTFAEIYPGMETGELVAGARRESAQSVEHGERGFVPSGDVMGAGDRPSSTSMALTFSKSKIYFSYAASSVIPRSAFFRFRNAPKETNRLALSSHKAKRMQRRLCQRVSRPTPESSG
jgi:glutamate synthase domain-containing protein 2